MTTIPGILIVDDDTVIAHLIAAMLRKKGYNIVGKITSGEESIGASAAMDPDLVIMDIHLSGVLDRITAARYIFQLFFCLVIFITGTDDETILDPARHSQPYGIIFKLFSSIKLTSNVDLALYNNTVHKRTHLLYPAGAPDDILGAHEVILLLDTKGRILLFNPYAA
jgi:DNA-binding NarL/FixJ family response regulator